MMTDKEERATVKRMILASNRIAKWQVVFGICKDRLKKNGPHKYDGATVYTIKEYTVKKHTRRSTVGVRVRKEY